MILQWGDVWVPLVPLSAFALRLIACGLWQVIGYHLPACRECCLNRPTQDCWSDRRLPLEFAWAEYSRSFRLAGNGVSCVMPRRWAGLAFHKPALQVANSPCCPVDNQSRPVGSLSAERQRRRALQSHLPAKHKDRQVALAHWSWDIRPQFLVRAEKTLRSHKLLRLYGWRHSRASPAKRRDLPPAVLPVPWLPHTDLPEVLSEWRPHKDCEAMRHKDLPKSPRRPQAIDKERNPSRDRLRVLPAHHSCWHKSLVAAWQTNPSRPAGHKATSSAGYIRLFDRDRRWTQELLLVRQMPRAVSSWPWLKQIREPHSQPLVSHLPREVPGWFD